MMILLNQEASRQFVWNANFMGWDLENGAGTDFGFGLYNRDAVTRLIRDDPDLLPRPKINKEKDYEWYNRIISNNVTNGILLGKSLDDIMLDIANDTGERSINAMLRNARTAYTGAQNAGREMSMRRIQAQGIRVEKLWSAFMDGVTRDAHAELNGKHVPPDEPFESLLGPIMRPGDPTAKPANVYNCRCCLKKFFPDYPDSSGERGGSGEDNDRNREAYERWKFQKGVGKDVKDVKKWLKERGKAKASASSKADPLAGATWANGPRAGQKYGQEAVRALTQDTQNAIITPEGNPNFKFDLQLFGEEDLKRQSAKSLEKGIKNLHSKIETHKDKISNPESFYPEWDKLPERMKQGNIRHWEKEIKNFEQSIRNREEELKRRRK